MTVLQQPVVWLEIAILTAVVGALSVRWFDNPVRSWGWGLAFLAAVLGCTVVGSATYYAQIESSAAPLSFQQLLLGKQFLSIDELNAPLLPLVALIHVLTALATGRIKMRRFSLSWSLASDALRLAIFGCTAGWLLVALLAISVLPPALELYNRGKPLRVYVVHMAAFVALLVLGWAMMESAAGRPEMVAWACVPLLAAVLIRCGAAPAHCWLTDWFEHASFGNALLFVAPLSGVYAALRLVLPVAPGWALAGIAYVSLFTALYAAGMALVQRETRRFFAYLFLSHASLVLVGLELYTSTSLTAALALWISASLSLTGLGLTLRAVEARYGRLSLVSFHGLYAQSPMLAVCFLLTGLGSVGFPGTLGFIGADLLVEEALHANLIVGMLVAFTAAINGISIVRVYFHLFTGARHVSTISMAISGRERVAVLTLAALILGGGLFPQPGVKALHEAAEELVDQRQDYEAAAQRPNFAGEVVVAQPEKQP
jgi:NADH-quinone oxidoreductase subunit M